MQNIRNFCIIAHVDHGKSTLADRLLEMTGTIEKRKMKAQYLDQLELERERGITIKMAPVRMIYHPHRRITQNDTQNNAEDFLYKDLTYKIRGLLFQVRKKIGLGHKEQVYHNAIEIELKNAGLAFESKKNISILYEGKNIGIYQPDFVVEDRVLIELKALPEISKPQIEQIWSYLKGCDYKLALLVNFGSKDLEIKRIVYDKARDNSFQRNSASSQHDFVEVEKSISNFKTHNDSFLRNSALSLRESAEVEEYILNLIDTPGHSDFSYEVSRALAAVDGAILLVDVTQGIQAQTLANFHSAKKAGLKIIGAVNKIDLDLSRVDEIIKSTAELIGVDEKEILKVSGKTGAGVEELLRAVIEQIPSPSERKEKKNNGIFRALVFDSFYHDHKGIVAEVRVFDGEVSEGATAHLIATNTEFKIKELGHFAPELRTDKKIETDQIAYIATGLKEPELLRIGDTIIASSLPLPADKKYLALAGYKEPQPVVFASFYPEDGEEYDELKKAFAKLKLNDSAIKYEPDFNEFLGRGLKAGFLGRLHFEIAAERLDREFHIMTVHSFPSVSYKVKVGNNDDWKIINNPKDFPDSHLEVMEPVAKVTILAPSPYLGAVMRLQDTFRFKVISTETIGGSMLIIISLPLADLIRDFDDQLKSASSGYASLSYEVSDYAVADVVKLGVLVAGQEVSGLTRIVHKDEVEREGRSTVEKLKDLLPKQQFAQSIQATANNKIIARETISAMKKDLGNFGKNGGDRTRKMKLWKKQKRGKERLKERASLSKINIPASVFKELLKK